MNNFLQKQKKLLQENNVVIVRSADNVHIAFCMHRADKDYIVEFPEEVEGSEIGWHLDGLDKKDIDERIRGRIRGENREDLTCVEITYNENVSLGHVRCWNAISCQEVRQGSDEVMQITVVLVELDCGQIVEALPTSLKVIG